MIYILLLEEEKFYVGYSARPIGDRFLEHFNHKGSQWTSLYRPIEVLEVRSGGKREENEVTLELMEIYGWWNVRGGNWCQVEMSSCPSALLERRRIHIPEPLNRQISYYSGSINRQKSSSNCYRCGRSSHYSNNCYARTHVNGQRLGYSNSYSFDDSDDSHDSYDSD